MKDLGCPDSHRFTFGYALLIFSVPLLSPGMLRSNPLSPGPLRNLNIALLHMLSLSLIGYREPMLQIRGMHTLIQDQDISKHDFIFYSDRLIRLVVEHGLGHLPFTEKQVVTPTGSVYTGVDFCKKFCGVFIVRRLDDVTLAQLLLPSIPARQ
ncbi:hypothetical protein RJ639_038570 [Escallonia herrerae]|uniref:Phosphoribosyltransferase domain-containing protein n=1 Tax=Escallonia herrerae TaxID=1293975 RepID=A0AA89B8N1_9ASTE|nr:hypothetical protein RJ639_038570 [Escallonia herrerae]